MSSAPAARSFFGHVRRLQVPIGPRPMKLYYPRFFWGRHEARLEVLRRIVTQLIREERIEMPLHRAFEARPYAERLVQLAVEYGPRDEYTMEMCQWWIMENDLIHKMFKVLVPRYGKAYISGEDEGRPFTTLWRLPNQLTRTPRQFRAVPQEFWHWNKMAVLELADNPFPPVVPQPANHEHSLLNVLVASARRRNQDKSTAERESDAPIDKRDPSWHWADKLGFL